MLEGSFKGFSSVSCHLGLLQGICKDSVRVWGPKGVVCFPPMFGTPSPVGSCGDNPYSKDTKIRYP